MVFLSHRRHYGGVSPEREVRKITTKNELLQVEGLRMFENEHFVRKKESVDQILDWKEQFDRQIRSITGDWGIHLTGLDVG